MSLSLPDRMLLFVWLGSVCLLVGETEPVLEANEAKAAWRDCIMKEAAALEKWLPVLGPPRWLLRQWPTLPGPAESGSNFGVDSISSDEVEDLLLSG